MDSESRGKELGVGRVENVTSVSFDERVVNFEEVNANVLVGFRAGEIRIGGEEDMRADYRRGRALGETVGVEGELQGFLLVAPNSWRDFAFINSDHSF